MHTGQDTSAENVAMLLVRRRNTARQPALFGNLFHACFGAAAFAAAWFVCFLFEHPREEKKPSAPAGVKAHAPVTLAVPSADPRANRTSPPGRSDILNLLWPMACSTPALGLSTPVDETTRPRHSTDAPSSAF